MLAGSAFLSLAAVAQNAMSDAAGGIPSQILLRPSARLGLATDGEKAQRFLEALELDA